MLRPMTELDIPAVVDLLQEMHRESPNYSALSYSPDRVAEVCGSAIASGYAVVYEVNGEIVGVMGGTVFQPPFSMDLMACDYVMYLKPGNRGIAAIRLADDYIRWAKQRGVKIIAVGVSAGIDNEYAAKFYEDMGFRRSGVQLMMEVI